MSISSCAGAASYIEFVSIHNETELSEPTQVTLSKGTVVGCIYLINGMCKNFPHIEGGSASIPAPKVEKAVCDGPNQR